MWLLWHGEYEGGNLIPMSIFRMVDERLDIVVRMRLRGRTSRSKRVLSLVSWSSLDGTENFPIAALIPCKITAGVVHPSWDSMLGVGG